MQDMVRVVVDAMGGDNAPGEIVKGAVEALNAREDIFIYLTGRKPVIEAELSKYTFPKERLEIVHTEEVIETAEPPVMAIRRKKDSSIVKGMNMVKQKEADAFVSAGSSGAILVGGQVIVGRIKGIERPPLAPLIPTKNGVSLLIDCGANVDARPSHLVQVASGRRRPVEIPGSEFVLDVDTVIMSLGTSPNPLISSTTIGLDVNKRKCIIADEETGKTSKDGVYAGGDAVTGAATVILAMGAGKAAAKGIHEFLSNK